MLVCASVYSCPGVVYSETAGNLLRRRPGIARPRRRLTTTSPGRPAMARPDSRRRKAIFSAPPNRRRSAMSPAPRARYGMSSRPRRMSRPSTPGQYSHNTKLATQLRAIAQLLRAVYSACVTAELALQGQNADQDHDIARTLRMHVSEPVSRQVERLESLLVNPSGSPIGDPHDCREITR